MRQSILAAMLLLISGTAHAAGPALASTGEATQATRIETDQKTGAVRIIVDGREVARFERDGLHVRRDVDYGGLMKDTGPQGYDKPATAEPKP
jgi:hypothetical protein